MTISLGTRFDLHLHTNASDGRYDLEEVLRRCARGGLDWIAITDHDLGCGLEPGERQVGDRVIRVLPGAEISGVHEGSEYHLLCYFPNGVPAAFHAFCREQCADREVRYEAALQVLGLDGRPEEAIALTRLHLAHALVEAGVVRDRGQAFREYLSDQHGLVPKMRLSFVQAIQTARQHGAITSWAHPPRGAVEKYLATFVEAGLQGLEALRPTIPGGERRYVRREARRHGLFLTGGSDWHGWRGFSPGLFRVTAREIGDFVDTLLAA